MEMPITFQTYIMERFMSRKELDRFYSNYQKAKKNIGFDKYEPTQHDIDLFHQYQAGKITLSQATELMGVKSDGTVTRRFLEIASLELAKK